MPQDPQCVVRELLILSGQVSGLFSLDLELDRHSGYSCTLRMTGFSCGTRHNDSVFNLISVQSEVEPNS